MWVSWCSLCWDVRYKFTIPFIAGAETTVNLAVALLYVLGSHPDIQRKGQSEIDSVIGRDRLPVPTDIQDLPYVHAIVKEVGRWFTVAPLGECQISSFPSVKTIYSPC